MHFSSAFGTNFKNITFLQQINTIVDILGLYIMQYWRC